VHGACRGVPAKFPSGGATLVVGGGRTVMSIVNVLVDWLPSVIVIVAVMMDPTWALEGIVKEKTKLPVTVPSPVNIEGLTVPMLVEIEMGAIPPYWVSL
jgi:hypothetical protein